MLCCAKYLLKASKLKGLEYYSTELAVKSLCSEISCDVDERISANWDAQHRKSNAEPICISMAQCSVSLELPSNPLLQLLTPVSFRQCVPKLSPANHCSNIASERHLALVLFAVLLTMLLKVLNNAANTELASNPR